MRFRLNTFERITINHTAHSGMLDTFRQTTFVLVLPSVWKGYQSNKMINDEMASYSFNNAELEIFCWPISGKQIKSESNTRKRVCCIFVIWHLWVNDNPKIHCNWPPQKLCILKIYHLTYIRWSSVSVSCCMFLQLGCRKWEGGGTCLVQWKLVLLSTFPFFKLTNSGPLAL